jgi:hypothetical protein
LINEIINDIKTNDKKQEKSTILTTSFILFLGNFIVISDKILERGEPIRDRCLWSVVDFFIGVDGIVRGVEKMIKKEVK